MRESPKNRTGRVPSTGERAEHPEEVRSVVDSRFEELIYHIAEKVNEGNNGIVFRFRMEDLLEGAIEDFAREGIFFEDEQAIKILKVYSPGDAKREFVMQRRVSEAVARDPDSANCARIPRPLLYRELSIGEGLYTFLKKNGYRSVERNVGLLVMDYVPGRDVATILYSEVLKRHPDSPYSEEEEIKKLDFHTMQRTVAALLQFAEPSRPVGGESDWEEQKIFNENAERLLMFLRRSNFRIGQRIVEQMNRTLKVLHKKGILWRDGHPRNWMVAGGHTESPQVYMVDFGNSITFEGEFREELYQEEWGKLYPRDETVPSMLKAFIPTAEGREEKRRNKFLNELNELGKRPEQKRFYEFARRAIETGNRDIEQLFDASHTFAPARTTESFLSLMYALVEDQLLSREEVRAYLEAELKRTRKKRKGIPGGRENLFLWGLEIFK